MLNTNTTAAEALAANFQVAELEPRLENAWQVVPEEPYPNPVPSCPGGDAPDGNGWCP